VQQRVLLRGVHERQRPSNHLAHGFSVPDVAADRPAFVEAHVPTHESAVATYRATIDAADVSAVATAHNAALNATV
jgi:hypothetical protein